MDSDKFVATEDTRGKSLLRVKQALDLEKSMTGTSRFESGGGHHNISHDSHRARPCKARYIEDKPVVSLAKMNVLEETDGRDAIDQSGADSTDRVGRVRSRAVRCVFPLGRQGYPARDHGDSQ